jgi:hypothetical protein
MASWPSSIVGTWHGFGNQTALKLVVSSQGTTGTCRAITGTLSNVPSGGDSHIQGFYCPNTGRVSFVRKDIKTNDAFQSYSACLADAGNELRMGGSFAELNMVGHLGEYSFSAEKKAD